MSDSSSWNRKSMGNRVSSRQAAGLPPAQLLGRPEAVHQYGVAALRVVLQAVQQLVVRRPLPVGKIRVAQQPERRVGVAVGLGLRDDVEVLAEIGGPRRADQTREGEDAQRLTWRAAQDDDTRIAQQAEPPQVGIAAGGDGAIVRARHRRRQLGAPRHRRRAAMRMIVSPAAMPPEPVRLVVAHVALGLPCDPEPARIGDRSRRGDEVGRNGERIEDSLQRAGVAALSATAVVAQPEVMEGRSGAVAPGDADGARLPPHAAEPTASRTIS